MLCLHSGQISGVVSGKSTQLRKKQETNIKIRNQDSQKGITKMSEKMTKMNSLSYVVFNSFLLILSYPCPTQLSSLEY